MHSNPNQKLTELRDRGYRVVVRHLRYAVNNIEAWDNYRARKQERPIPAAYLRPVEAIRAKRLHVSPRGGMTYVAIFRDSLPDPLAEGAAWCNPRDAFNKHLGLMIALGRAIHGTPFAKPLTEPTEDDDLLQAAAELGIDLAATIRTKRLVVTDAVDEQDAALESGRLPTFEELRDGGYPDGFTRFRGAA